jgi:hypothetical protein
MIRALKLQMIFVWVVGAGAAQPPANSQLGDFVPVRTNKPAELTFGAACSTATPCYVRFNQKTIRFTTGGTVVLSGSSPKGKAYAYITSDGKVIIGSKLSISSCTGCTAVSGVDNFPANTIPLWTWTADSVAGVWDRDGGEDWRGFQSAKVIVPGPGIHVTDSPDQTAVAIDTAVVQQIQQSTPSNSSAPCTPGAIWSDGNYIYVCVASGTIKRAALSTF